MWILGTILLEIQKKLKDGTPKQQIDFQNNIDIEKMLELEQMLTLCSTEKEDMITQDTVDILIEMFGNIFVTSGQITV